VAVRLISLHPWRSSVKRGGVGGGELWGYADRVKECPGSTGSGPDHELEGVKELRRGTHLEANERAGQQQPWPPTFCPGPGDGPTACVAAAGP
jgi:hypothetical protein